MLGGSSISVDRRKCIFSMPFPHRSTKMAIHGKRRRLLKNAIEVYPKHVRSYISVQRKHCRIQLFLNPHVLKCRDRSERYRANHSGHLKKLTSDAGVFLASAKEHHGNDACREYVKVGNGRWNEIRWSKRRRKRANSQERNVPNKLLPWVAGREGRTEVCQRGGIS